MPVDPIPRFSDEPVKEGIPFADFYDRVRRGEREFVLPDGGKATVEVLDLTGAAPNDTVAGPAATIPAPIPAAPSLRDAILVAGRPRATVITVPTWGGVKLEVRALDGDRYATWTERVVMRAGTPDEPDAATVVALACVLAVHDPETHEPVFGLGDLDAVKALDVTAQAQIVLVMAKMSPLPGLNLGAAPEAAG